MSALVDTGLFVGMLLLSALAFTRLSGRVDRAMTRLALAAFRRRVETEGRHRQRRSRALQSIHATTTYPVYASLTLLHAAVIGVAGTLVSVWVIQQSLLIMAVSEAALRASLPPELAFIVPTNFGQPSAVQVFGLLLLSGATLGTGGTVLAYKARWWLVSNAASRRAVLIDESLARTIAFIYALSRSGMTYPEIMRTVGANRKAFGESAEEIGVIVKDMDLFGADLITALNRTARRTPSEQFADFAENFANVLRSGQNVSAYLRDQYEQYQTERVDNQEQLLELFTALGEAYVAALVAGPLFLITILIIWGVLTGGFLAFLQFIVYLMIPLANLGFVVYLDAISEPLTSFAAPVQQTVASRGIDVRRADAPGASRPRADGGAARPRYDLETNRLRLRAHDRLRRLRRAALDPVETVVTEPATLLYVTVPLALVVLFVRSWPVLSGAVPQAPQVLDDLVVQSALLVVASFAVVQEVHSRRLRGIEAAVPDLLDRLASTNDAGMTFTESLRRVDKSDLGALDVEVERLLADIDWGARTERALNRFNERIGSSTVARIVALITNAMLASGHLGPVIRIAADEAREDWRLRRKRRQEMVMYVLIIYLSFVVFLGIAVALQTILVPAIPTTGDVAGVAEGSELGVGLPITPAQGPAKDAYTLLLFHAAMLQAAVSGFVAGQMGEGSVRDGAKHVTVMVLVAYAVFLLIA